MESQVLNQLRELIAKNELREAIKRLQELLNGSDLLNELILHSARYNDLMKQIRMGTIISEELNIHKNKIIVALLEMINILEEKGENNESIKKEFENFKHLASPINIINSKNVVTGNINVGHGNVHIGDNIVERKGGEIKWGGLSLYKKEEEKYEIDVSNNAIKIYPMSSLQKIADWPGKYGEEFPLFIDMKFLNAGDSSKIINEIRVFVKDTCLDTLPAFEQEVYINKDGNLVFSINNFGWGKNKVIDFNIFNEASLNLWKNINQLNLNRINLIDGHILIEMSQHVNCDLNPMSEEEFKNFDELYHSADTMWTPNPSELLFNNYSTNEEIENEFTIYRDTLISQRKILDSKSFFGNLIVEANGKIINRKLNWGYISYQGASFDLMIVNSNAGNLFKLFRYQELLAPLPPSAEYDLELSVNDKGKTLIIDEPHILQGGEGDRIILKVNPKEALFADIEISIKTDDDELIQFSKELNLNLLRFKQNGREEVTQKNDIKTTKYFFDGESIKEITAANK